MIQQKREEKEKNELILPCDVLLIFFINFVYVRETYEQQGLCEFVRPEDVLDMRARWTWKLKRSVVSNIKRMKMGEEKEEGR